MAGDWIKMRVDLQTHPKVVRILSATSTDKFRVIGGLHAVWAVFDTHSEDGRLKGYTPELLDHVIAWQGFSRALEAVGWLGFDGLETLQLPDFDAHNGQSGKRRAEDQKRKRDGRQRPQSVRNESAPEPDKKRTREEKRREEKEEAKPSQADACPQQTIIDLFHEVLPTAQRVKVWTGKREAHLRSRWREDPKRQTPDYWRRLFAHCSKSDFLMGRTSSPGHAPFVLTLAWLVNAENFAKVIEGNYHAR